MRCSSIVTTSSLVVSSPHDLVSLWLLRSDLAVITVDKQCRFATRVALRAWAVLLIFHAMLMILGWSAVSISSVACVLRWVSGPALLVSRQHNFGPLVFHAISVNTSQNLISLPLKNSQNCQVNEVERRKKACVALYQRIVSILVSSRSSQPPMSRTLDWEYATMRCYPR